MRKIIKEIRLKKDTPDHKAGERFVLMSNNGIYEIDAGEDDPSVFYGGDVDNFDEWFEKVDESSDWLHNGTIYYRPEVGVYDERFLPCSDMFRGTEYDIARQRIGFCHKSAESCRRFIDFLEAVEVVSHDDGFMKQDKIQGEVWELRRAYLDSEELFTARRIEYEGFHHLGAFYFDTEEHAIASSEKHHSEWETILNYDWSKGEDEEEDED